MKLHLALVSACAALAACGGGGGDDGSSGGTPVPLSDVNYVTAAREAISPASFLFDSTSLPLAVISGAQVSNANVIFRFSNAQLRKISGWFSSAPAQFTGATQSEIYPCDDGVGQLTVTFTDVNDNQLPDPGDSIALSASGCSFDGSLVDGAITMVIDSISGEFGALPFALSASLILNNLTVRSGDAVEAATGSFSVTSNMDVFSSLNTVNVARLSMSSTYGTETVSRTLTNYAVSETVDNAAATATVLVSGSVGTGILQSNVLTVETVSPVMIIGEAEPSSGQVLVSAELGGKVRITATTGGNAFIELDADGDGAYEISTTVPWDELV